MVGMARKKVTRRRVEGREKDRHTKHTTQARLGLRCTWIERRGEKEKGRDTGKSIYIDLHHEMPDRPKNCFVSEFHTNLANAASAVCCSSCLVEPFSAAILVKVNVIWWRVSWLVSEVSK